MAKRRLRDWVYIAMAIGVILVGIICGGLIDAGMF